MNPLTTREQAELIAALVHEIRPEWDTPGILATIAKVAHRHPADVMMAAARLAMSEAKTPGALANQAAECWRERVTVPRAPVNAKPGEACHCGRLREVCGCPPLQLSTARDSHLEALRKERAARLAEKCCPTCHVPWATCPHDQPTPAAVASVATPEGEKTA